MDSDLDWISHGALEQLAGAHRTTVARWKRRARAGRPVPAWLLRLVNALYRGQLGELHAAWRGWLINPHDGEIVTPEGLSFTPGQVRALPQLQQLRSTLEAEIRQLRAERLEMPIFTPAPALAIRCGKSRRIRAEASRAGELDRELLEARTVSKL